MAADPLRSYKLMGFSVTLVILGVSSLGINMRYFHSEADFILGCGVVGVGIVAFIAAFGYRIAYVVSTILASISVVGAIIVLFYTSASSHNSVVNIARGSIERGCNDTVIYSTETSDLARKCAEVSFSVALVVINAFITIICVAVGIIAINAAFCTSPKDHHIFTEEVKERLANDYAVHVEMIEESCE